MHIKTKPIGYHIDYHDTLDSTNDTIKDVLNNERMSIDSGYVLWTGYQRKGKGQRNNSWKSAKNKNILMSFYIKYMSPLEHFFLLHCFTALAIRDLLIQLEVRHVSVKWMNDIYVKEKKIAGILIENRFSGKRLTSSIIGIGLNTNQKTFSLSSHYAPTSIILEQGKTMDNTLLMVQLCQYLEKRFQMLTSHPKQLVKEYNSHLYLKNQSVHYSKQDNKICQGKIIKVLENGDICIKHNNKIHAYSFEQIKLLNHA